MSVTNKDKDMYTETSNENHFERACVDAHSAVVRVASELPAGSPNRLTLLSALYVLDGLMVGASNGK